ncbi:MAG: hypothetical protein EOP37_01600 [Rubrivivax sp.]|nr:MAG: hypothetical protein EOP37_01600 [Rubrivivax sp.]
MARNSKSWGRGVMAVLAALAVAALLNGCGGGGDDCEVTGERADVYFTPSIPVTDTVAQDALTYSLNQRNTWTPQPRGMTAACLTGVKVELRDNDAPLPAGFTIDAATGAINSGVMTRHVEGRCERKVGNATESGPMSTGRVCPEGYTLRDQRYVVLVTSDRFNNNTRVPTALVFRPAQ